MNSCICQHVGYCDGSCQHPPEIWKDCEACCGEGGIEKWESVSKWSIDPPSAIVVPCDACRGAGGFISEAEGDR